MHFKYAYKTNYYIMDSTHKYVVEDAQKNWKKTLIIKLRSIDAAQGLSPSYSPRWKDKLSIEPVHKTLMSIREAIEKNNFCLEHAPELESTNPKFEIIIVSEEIDCLVASDTTIQESLQDELDAALALKRKHFEEFSKLLDFDKLTINEIDKLQKVITG